MSWPFMSSFKSGQTSVSKEATCVGCGCTDRLACTDGCSWAAADRRTGRGVCSNCTDHLEAWKAQQRAGTKVISMPESA